MFIRLFLIFIFSICASVLYGHEFWIDPVEYQVDLGEKIEADFRVGAEMDGARYAFITFRTVRHAVGVDGKIFDLPGRAGDRPAMQVSGAPEGLVTLIHETRDERLTYKEREKFVNFLTHKDALWALQDHKDRDLPDTGFEETYRRHAKALVAVGDGEGNDVRAGMRIEFVAQANPYFDDMSDGLPLQLWLDDGPRANAQVEVFERAPNGEVTITLLRTDVDGRVSVPAKSGHTYLIDSVALFPLDPVMGGDPVWHSAWASLTYQVP